MQCTLVLLIAVSKSRRASTKLSGGGITDDSCISNEVNITGKNAEVITHHITNAQPSNISRELITSHSEDGIAGG